MRSQHHVLDVNGRRLAALVARRYRRAADAQRVLETWRRSGQSVAAFARQHGLNPVRLLRWRERQKPSVPGARGLRPGAARRAGAYRRELAMLTLGTRARIYVAAEAVDLRKGFDTLAAATRAIIREDPLSGHWFVFFNWRQNGLKVLVWEPHFFPISE